MRPSAEAMMQAAQKALRELVAPVVADQWAASALRSVDVILNHLQARTPVEGPMLYEDNGDLAAVLGKVLESGLFAAVGGRLKDFRAEANELRQTYPPVAALSELNTRGREILDEVLRLCHASKDHRAAFLHQELRDYLTRHLEREQTLFFPTFVGRPV
jgi:hypothetical protein